jgi:transposase-like protein
MAEPILTALRFNDEQAARTHLEAIRWPNGPICPHCGGTERNSRLNGKAHRPGLVFCGDCRTQFSVTVGTVFEDSKVPLHKWIAATHLMCASKKGISSKQLERMLGVTYKTAWFMSHRIRKAMEKQHTEPMGGFGKIVEADETYWGNIKNKKVGGGGHHKMKVVSLVEREGKVRSFHVPSVNAKTLKPLLKRHVAAETSLMTDEAGYYRMPGLHFRSHDTVNHTSGEYGRGIVHTNTIEGFFSLLKRGLIGTFHHVGEQHLQRYVSEFDFRYNSREKLGIDDEQRTTMALKGISGKRLTYRRTHA